MHKFRIMVHSDPSMPMLEFVESFGALQVCSALFTSTLVSGFRLSTIALRQVVISC